jgi:hypothetical protein
VRVGEEADVEEKVGVTAGPVLEAEALEGDREAPRRPRRQQLVGELAAQHRRGQAGRVDHEVGTVAQRQDELALALDALDDAARGRERMPPARLLVAGQQGLLVRFQEQHPVRHAARAQVVEDRLKSLEVAAAADVRDNGGARDLRSLVSEQLHEGADHLRRQVVDAEIALILERRHRG